MTTSPTQPAASRPARLCRPALVAAAAVSAGLTLAACEQTTAPPPAQPNTGNTGGGLSNLAENPQSLLGRSAGMARDTAQAANTQQQRTVDAANELAGNANQVALNGVTFTVPAGWQKVAPAGAMRAAELRTPGNPGATVIFFAFPHGQGGSVKLNVDRYAGMVVAEDGRPIEPRVTPTQIDGVLVTLMAMEGTYRDGMPGQPATPRPGYGFRAALADTAQGLVAIRMYGPRADIEAAEPEWQQMINGMRVR